MSRTKSIVIGFGPAAKRRQPVVLTDRAEAAFSPGQHFVNVGLVSDIPDDLVFGGIEDLVEGDCELDHPQARSEMSAFDRNDAYQLISKLPTEGLEFIVRQALQV